MGKTTCFTVLQMTILYDHLQPTQGEWAAEGHCCKGWLFADSCSGGLEYCGEDLGPPHSTKTAKYFADRVIAVPDWPLTWTPQRNYALLSGRRYTQAETATSSVNMWNMSDRFVFMLTSNKLYSSWFSGFGFQMYAFMADKVSNSEVSVNTSNLCELKTRDCSFCSVMTS